MPNSFEHDGEAVDFLKSKGYHFYKGMGWHPDKNSATEEEGHAMDYLFNEWDYAFCTKEAALKLGLK